MKKSDLGENRVGCIIEANHYFFGFRALPSLDCPRLTLKAYPLGEASNPYQDR